LGEPRREEPLLPGGVTVVVEVAAQHGVGRSVEGAQLAAVGLSEVRDADAASTAARSAAREIPQVLDPLVARTAQPVEVVWRPRFPAGRPER